MRQLTEELGEEDNRRERKRYRIITLDQIVKEEVRRLILEEGKRPDGRTADEIRRIVERN